MSSTTLDFIVFIVLVGVIVFGVVLAIVSG
jgi:hypothetical protein